MKLPNFGLFYILLFLSIPLKTISQSFTINGYIHDEQNSEALINASIVDEYSEKGAISNDFGFFSLTLPQDSVKLRISYSGFSPTYIRLYLDRDTTFLVDLKELHLENIEISAESVSREVESAQMGEIVIPLNQVKLMPALLGEVDIIKAIQLMPGVQSGSEGSSGLYVRGGGSDQNLILLDGVPLYYVSHLGGFFSVFNTDALGSVKLYKGGFPARYGGRLSSILDIRMKEGNLNKFEGEGSIGLVSSKLSLQGPIQKGKSSFIISARRTYLDLISRQISRFVSDDGIEAGYFFYDLNGKINHKFSDKDHIYLSFYMGDDKFGGKGETTEDTYEDQYNLGLAWGNRVASLRWSHIWSRNLFMNISTNYSQYQLNTQLSGKSSISTPDTTLSDFFGLAYLSQIKDRAGRIDFDYYPSPSHAIRFGIQSTFHTFEPGTLGINHGSTEASIDTNRVSQLDYTFESGIYIEDQLKIGNRFSANIGLHGAHYLIKSKSYYSFQPRLSARIALSKDLAFKASYVQMNQFIHLLTNSGTGLPIDQWLPATEKVPPQFSWQTAAGISASIKQDKYQLSLEAYYKEMRGLITYKEGNNFFLGNIQENSWEETVETGGKGESYGAELLFQKKQGKTTGWIAYTIAWNWRQFDNINQGKRYPYKYDRRHDLSLVISHTFNERVSLSGTWVFGTGNAISLPTAGFASVVDPLNPNNENLAPSNISSLQNLLDYTPFRRVFTNISGYGNGARIYENGRNGFRMESYHRLDIGINFSKKKKWGSRTWVFGFYNVYSRLNPFTYYLDENLRYNQETEKFETEPTLKKIAIFPIIPSISYIFKF